MFGIRKHKNNKSKRKTGGNSRRKNHHVTSPIPKTADWDRLPTILGPISSSPALQDNATLSSQDDETISLSQQQNVQVNDRDALIASTASSVVEGSSDPQQQKIPAEPVNIDDNKSMIAGDEGVTTVGTPIEQSVDPEIIRATTEFERKMDKEVDSLNNIPGDTAQEHDGTKRTLFGSSSSSSSVKSTNPRQVRNERLEKAEKKKNRALS